MSLYDDYGSGGSGGGSSDSLYGSYAAPKAPTMQRPQPAGIPFGDIAHSFLSGLAHAATHPISTINDNFVKPTVDAWKKAPSDVSNLTKGTIDATKGALSSDKNYQMAQLKKVDEEFSKTFAGQGLHNIIQGQLDNKGQVKKNLDVNSLIKGGRQVAGSTLGEGMNLTGPIGGGEKVGAELVGKAGVKAAIWTGVKAGGAYGLAQGASQALQEDKLTLQKAAEDVGTNLLAGGIMGGVTHGAAAWLNKALHGWVNLTAEQAHPEAHAPAPASAPVETAKPQLALPAASTTNPVKQTAGPNGGVFGDFNRVSEETAGKLSALNHTIHDFALEGEKVAPESRTVDANAPVTKGADSLQHLSQIQNLRNTAAHAVDSIANDRAEQLKAMHQDFGGVSLIRNEDRMVTGRGSSNDPFYSKVYKETGKPPTKPMWLEEAHRQLQFGADDQAKHYQQAAQIVETAHKAYQEKVASFKTSDVYATQVSAEKAAAAKAELPKAEAQAAKERIDGQAHAPAPAKEQVPVPDLIKQLHAAEAGKSTAGRVGILNQLIEHNDIAPEHKQAWIDQRDAILPSNKGKEPAAAVPKETGVVPAAVGHDLSASDLTVAKEKPKVSSSELTATKEPGVVGKDSDVTAPSGSRTEKLFDKATKGAASGLINPGRAASREGNVGLAREASSLVSSKRQRTYLAKDAAKELKGLMKGLSHDDVNAAIEGGVPKNDKVALAAAFFNAHRDAIGGESTAAGTIKGEKQNYLPHVAQGLESDRKGGGANGLKKNTRYNIERQSIETVDAHGNVVKEDKYKTIGEFDKAIKALGGKGAERDTTKLLEHLLTTEGHAVENVHTINKLMDTRMTDGRPVLAATSEANLNSPKFKGYAVIDNKLVHPDAKSLYDAITRTGRIDNAFGAMLAKGNTFSKRLTTLNGVVHALNIWKSSYAAQGVTRSVWAIGSRGATKEDFVRALGYGAKFARASNDNLFDEVGKQTGLLGKFEKATDPLTHALFNGFGDRQGMSTYKTIEKQMLKKGLGQDESGRIAAEAANQVMHFVPEDQQSIVVRQSSQLALFAGQFLQNTLKTGTNAVGIGLDRTLSKEGQRASQVLAIKRITRMFAYSFASAQAINLAATGKYTWQNNNGDPLNPVWFETKDKYGNVKQYRITNHYGQLKDLAGFLTDPYQEVQNKLAPGAREAVSQIANTDLFTGDHIAKKNENELTQATDRLVHAASNMFTPAGVNLASPSKQPGIVQTAKYLGINSSSAKPNDHTDYGKLATDKKETQSLLDAYAKGDQSKLAGMQALKAAGNSRFDKFFSEHPNLDPTNSQFSGWKANNAKEVSAGIKEGFAMAKANGNSLAYMQSIKESGSKYFDKFFAANPVLDPTSDQYQPKSGGSRQNSQAKYLAKKAKFAGGNLIKARAPKTLISKSGALKAPRSKAGGSLVRRTKKVGF